MHLNNYLGTLETGAVAGVTVPPTDEWERLCNHGLELAQLEDRISWRLADLCEKVRTCGKYGTSRMEDFAKRINRGRSYVYSRAQLARFYGDDNLRAMIDLCEFASFSHCELLRRFTVDIDVVTQWLVRIESDAMTYDELHLQLLIEFKKMIPPTPALYKGVYSRSQLRDVINTLTDGDYDVRIKRI